MTAKSKRTAAGRTHRKSTRRDEPTVSHVSYTELRQHLAHYMDAVGDSRAPLRITRQNARSVVMIDEAEYDGLMETLHLLRSPANAVRLLRSIESAEAGRLVEHPTVEDAGDG